jgi:hypothetical protein
MEPVGGWALIIGRDFSETERFGGDLGGLVVGAWLIFRNKIVPSDGKWI